jgi:hypothetical protein
VKSQRSHLRWLGAVGALMPALLVVPAPAVAQTPPAAPTWSATPGEGWALIWPVDQPKIAFQGVVNLDQAGVQHGGILYQGGAGLAGLLVQVLAHAAITNAARSSQKNTLQDEADKVLSDYRSAIDGFAPDDLLRRTTALLRASAPELRDAGAARWAVEVLPIFRMTQDRRALIVDSVVTVRATDAVDVVRRVAVRVVSDPLLAEGAAERWATDEGEPLKRESTKLLAQAVELSLSDIAGRWDASAAPQRTIRYDEGGDERVERAQVLDQGCSRSLVRTLRGDLMSVPRRGADAAGCTASPDRPAAAEPAK